MLLSGGVGQLTSRNVYLLLCLVQAPVELFKNQTKVGILKGNMLGNMTSALQKGEYCDTLKLPS